MPSISASELERRLNDALRNHFGADSLLQVQALADDTLSISAAPADIEALIRDVASREAAKQGVTIDSVQLSLQQCDAHALAAEVQLRARKLFLAATIRITAQFDLDEQLNARISGARCTGDGAIATLACGFLAPHLQKIDGRTFPLISLPLGEVPLRDVQMSVGDRLTVTAQFESGREA